jgi:hypothetical protein
MKFCTKLKMQILFSSRTERLALFTFEYCTIFLPVMDYRAVAAWLGDSHSGFAFQVPCLSS